MQTKTQAYTAYDLTKMLEDMGLQDSVAPLYEAEVKDYLNIFEAPLVDTYALYGYGVSGAIDASAVHTTPSAS